MSQLDVRDPASIEELVAEVTAAWGELSIVINNAGMCPYTSPDDITIDEWDAVLETNARGTFLMTRAALPLLRAANGRPVGGQHLLDSRADRWVHHQRPLRGQQGRRSWRSRAPTPAGWPARASG